jgi:hypothetical protein
MFKIKLTALEINDYPETDHPPIEDIVDDSMDLKIESFVYPETDHPTIEDIIEI